MSRRLVNLFIEPIESINSVSSQLAEGKLNYKISENYPGELGALAHSLN
ncbi:HAMP domain protein [Bacillus clarus]|uniref:HAMP domain protein n=1 Tax=Bacillus clarus TaxID=2338372 RepID=A0A090YSN7_9BACI|nr:HAMP domain protein [Bacillus clarus]